MSAETTKLLQMTRRLSEVQFHAIVIALILGVGYKGIRLSAFLQGVGKADGYLNSYYVMPCYQGGTYRKEHLDY